MKGPQGPTMHPSDSPPAFGSDTTILRLLRERDSQGLRMLLARHGDNVRDGIRKALGTMLAINEVDEAMNTAAYQAWRSVDTYDPAKGTLRAWFFVIARNAGREIMRKRQKRGFEVRGEEIERMAAADATSAEETKDSPFLTALRECIDALPRMQKHIIQADLGSGDVADAGELAKALKTSKNSIYVSRSTARKTLRRALLERGFEAGGEQGNTSCQ